MGAVGAVVRLASRRLALIVSVVLAPGVLASVAWLGGLGVFPWALQAIGTAIVLVMWVDWLLMPYAVLWCLALLVSDYIRGSPLRIASLIPLVAAALFLDGSTAFLAWGTLRLGGKAAIYTFATPALQLLGLSLLAPLWGLSTGLTALITRAARASGAQLASTR
jgi:hypothetical protein